MLSNQVKSDAKKYNTMYNAFMLSFYDGGEPKYYQSYGRAYSAASAYISKGHYLAIYGLLNGKSTELAAC